MSHSDEQPGNGLMRWMRLDLHLHTPASEDYVETNVSYLDILREAERRHLDIIAFTDHNTVHGYEQFRAEIEFLGRMVQADRCTEEERERYDEYQRILDKITVLPGFEFTSHYGAHILGIFSPATPLSVLEAVLLQLGIAPHDIKSGTCSVPDTRHVTDAYEIIARSGGIVIAPHINAPSGIVTETLRMGSSGQSRVAATQSPNLHALEFVHFYTSHETFLNPGFYNGQHDHYERQMFCIQGSDAHRVRRIGNDAVDPKRTHGIGDRYFEAQLPERTFEALKALFASTAFDRVRVPKRDQKQWEIDNIRLNGESRHFISRPASAEYLETAWRDVAALANVDGGILIIGNDASPQRLAPTEISERLRQIIAQHIEPKPAVSLELMSYEGHEVVRVEVKPDDLPPYITSDGALYVRRDDATVPATRDELLQLARRALASGATSPLDNGEELELPRSGVEIVGEQKRGGVWTYEVRDLRTTTGVERDRAQGLWAYAISRHEELREAGKIDLNGQVRWHGRLGVWRTFQQGNRAKYDLLHRDANGVVDHIFYGVSEWGLGEGWRTLLGLSPHDGEETVEETPAPRDDAAAFAAQNDYEPAAEETWLPWGDRKYRWKGRGGLWRIYGHNEKLRFDLAMKNKDDEEYQEFRDVASPKLTEAWVNLIRVQPPTTGIEVVSVEENEWGRSFRFRNLRTNEISDPWRYIDLEPGTVREYAARMFMEDMPIDEASVRWWGNIGYMRPMRSQVDLVYRDHEGVDHIYYAARREELENEWSDLLEQWPDE